LKLTGLRAATEIQMVGVVQVISMTLNGKYLQVFDIEVLPHVFTCTILDHNEEIQVYEISERRNDAVELCQTLVSRTDVYYVGYNNHNYDDIILNYLIDITQQLQLDNFGITNTLNNLSAKIIKGNDFQSYST
jgi:hypothetical protein